MKITKVSKSITYYIETDAAEFPDYRTDTNGTYWENAMGESWEPVYDVEELQKLFREYMKHNEVEE